MLKKVLCTIIFLLCNFFFALPIVAQEKDFKTDVKASYVISQNGLTTVTQTFNIENLKPDVFLREYRVTFGDPKISNITAQINQESIKPTVVTTNNETVITIYFPEDAVGQGKKRDFSITYQTTSSAIVTGKVLEIHVPLVKDADEIDTFVTEVVTPITFGQPTRITPQPTSSEVRDSVIVNTFAQSQADAITAFFGSKQYFDLAIRYNLQNKGSTPALAQVALPPDTSFQRVYYNSIEPRPQELKIDDDGNWIATYQVPANTTLTPQLSGSVHIQLDPFSEVPVTQPKPHHTAAQEYWPVGEASFQSLVKEHQSLKAQYQYVIDTFSYSENINLSQLKRLGATSALQQKNEVVCQEYADTFVTLARTAQFPARGLTGYGYTQDPTLRPQNLEGDVLHAWAEYYDSTKNVWVQVDPTWEDTTGGLDYFNQFDLNHIVFAINGKSSTIPYPGGSYKTENQKSKDVEVKIAEDFPSFNPVLSLDVIPKKIFGLTVPGQYKILIQNESGNAWYNLDIKTNSAEAHTITFHSSPERSTILPFQTVTLPISISNNDWLLQNQDITVSIAIPNYDTNVTKTFKLTSSAQQINWIFEKRTLISVAIGCSVFTVVTGSLLVSRQRRKRPLRRKS